MKNKKKKKCDEENKFRWNLLGSEVTVTYINLVWNLNDGDKDDKDVVEERAKEKEIEKKK